MSLTSEEVLALAPDPASAAAGRGLSAIAKWQLVGTDGEALWGECKGSGASPYRTRVELASNGYNCSCPSRKFPCKHVLGLMLIGAGGNAPAQTQPDWVQTWLASRREKREKPVAASRASKLVDEATAAADAAKRAAKREERVAQGLDEMDRWLCDIVAVGIGRLRTEKPSFWDAKAARLVDAQAPGLARRVSACAGIVASGTGWEERLLDALGALHLLREAYSRIGTLPPERQADVRRHIGWTTREADVLTRPLAKVEDRWFVLGARRDEDDRIVVHRAWLRGERTGRDALVLQFTPGNVAPPHILVPGSAFAADVAYFEASVPMRVALGTRGSHVEAPGRPAALSVAAALERFSACVAEDPWFEILPVCLGVARLHRAGENWFVCDEEGDALPLTRSDQPYVLHALCGDRPIMVTGEWNGRALTPLAVVEGDRFVAVA